MFAFGTPAKYLTPFYFHHQKLSLGCPLLSNFKQYYCAQCTFLIYEKNEVSWSMWHAIVDLVIIPSPAYFVLFSPILPPHTLVINVPGFDTRPIVHLCPSLIFQQSRPGTITTEDCTLKEECCLMPSQLTGRMEIQKIHASYFRLAMEEGLIVCDQHLVLVPPLIDLHFRPTIFDRPGQGLFYPPRHLIKLYLNPAIQTFSPENYFIVTFNLFSGSEVGLSVSSVYL